MKESQQNIRENYSNTIRLFNLWDDKYKNQQNDEKVFSGNVDKYELKYIKNSQFIILNNPSRIQKKVNHIQNSNSSLKQPVKINKITLEVNQEDFNFHKIHKQQILTYFDQKVSQIFNQQINSKNFDQMHSIIINKVPICKYHCLFIPWIQGKLQIKEGLQARQILPQMITHQSLPLVIKLLSLFNDLIIGFNSIGASASVNHLHFHMFFKKFWIGQQNIPIFSLFQTIIKAQKYLLIQQNVSVLVLESQLIQGFLLQFSSNISQKDHQLIYSVLQVLISKNIPHNILFFKQDLVTKVMIFPRKFQQKDGIKFACMQFSGVFCLDYEKEKFKQIKISKPEFDEIIEQIQNTLTNITLLNQ